MKIDNFFAELKRRNVYKVAVAYAVAGWALAQGIAQVPLHPGLVLARARVADDFQVGDLGQIGKDLVLHAIGEVTILFVGAYVLKRQHCN